MAAKTSTLSKVMAACSNWFAVRCERVSNASISGAAVTAAFKGQYAPGQLVRIHGAFRNTYADFHAGSVYEVECFSGGVLTLDKPLHTTAPYLFIVLLEPTQEFTELCGDIEDYEASIAGREGLASESIDGYSWSAGANGTGFAAAFADKLKPYRCPDNPTPLYYARECHGWQ